MNWFQKLSTNNISLLQKYVPEICQKIQIEYNAWDQSDSEFGDGDLGFGGICQNFAEIISDVLNQHGIDASTVSSQCGEQHVYTIAKMSDGVYEIDIPYHIYETGGGYNWKKIENIIFDSSHVSIDRISNNPSDYDQYTEYN